MRPAKQIVDDALKLDRRERAHVPNEIIASLDGEKDEDVDRLWAEEIERRSQEIDAGTAELVDWSEVRARIDSRIRGR